MQVDFYQLSRDPVEAVIPAIARRVLDGGGRLLVVSARREQLERVSGGLWSAGAETYLANDHDDAPAPHVQPILLSGACVPLNAAGHVALADGMWRDEALDFERAFYFFDDETVGIARQAWKKLSGLDAVTPRFWKQEGGRWRQGP